MTTRRHADTARTIDRTRSGYDAVASAYTDRFGDELDSKPLDREVLDDFARRDDGLGVVVDLGCGPGQVATYLAAQGVPVVGVDLSQAWSSSADMENHLDTAGFEVVWSRERVPYPDVEADTERAYLLARRPA